jgi:hypothetical protein
MGPQEAKVPSTLIMNSGVCAREGYLLLVRSNSLITWSVKSMVSLL